MIEVIATEIPGVFLLEPRVFGDNRGYFMESFNLREFSQKTGQSPVFVQDNESSSRYGVVRGLHFQKGKSCQAKLVRVVKGSVLDVAVDIRSGSPTYGRHFGAVLSGENHRMLYIPRGFAHGFSVLSESVVFQYKCDNYYDPSSEGGIAWNDPDIGIDWMIPAEDAVLSAKDSDRIRLRDLDPSDTGFVYGKI